MESYILKNTQEEEKVLLYQEQNGYAFTPKKGLYRVKKITVLNEAMISSILKEKLMKNYKRLLQIIYSLINAGDETTSGDVLLTYTELDRLKGLLLYKYAKYLDRKFIKEFYEKLEILEMELKKLHVMQLEEEIEYSEEKGKGR